MAAFNAMYTGVGASGGPGMPVRVLSYGGPAEPAQKIGSYGNRLGPGDVAISPNLIPFLGKPAPDNYVMLNGQRYHVADTSWYSKNNPTSNTVEVWGYGNQINQRGNVAKAYAGGGIIDKPTLAMMGEKGPEAVVPLARSAPIHLPSWLVGGYTGSLSWGGGGKLGLGSLINPYTGGSTLGRALGAVMHFAPEVHIHGDATRENLDIMDSKLRSMAADFIERFKEAQHQERRLSYESGYA
jgi:hypothetical protein